MVSALPIRIGFFDFNYSLLGEATSAAEARKHTPNLAIQGSMAKKRRVIMYVLRNQG